MPNLYPKYLKAIRYRVCGVCTERTVEGTCGLSWGATCPIEMYLPKIVETVHGVSSDKMADYVEALRKNVCAQCPNQGTDGKCPFRRMANCVLDRYFALIVDAIEEVDEMISWPQAC